MASDPKVKGDELGRTATAPVSSTSVPETADPIGPTVGRYRLERELGAGGMGVVHAAFDPDLQRRIALKVLRVAASGTEAKDRLLREARAMARLAHPNVVTVHEVGTASGRDYVAMELIVGETLADWLRSERRRSVDVVAAFVAAGRGLAAAHAAGIVHRDFKPHNVLRSRQGRIVVTDFGLAREAQADLPAQLDVTLPLAARIALPTSMSTASLAGITVTGSLLGTPAYMAPEQWGSGLVTPATDQYAYCVALWEALAGERPYRGPTLDDLRSQAALGPSALDASKIPRRLRATLRRGLDPDPALRWPSMDALLSRLVRAERRPGLAFALAAGAFVSGAAVLIIAGHAHEHLAGGPACAPPVLDPAKVWSSAAHADLGNQTGAATLLDRDIAAWTTARAGACHIEPVARAPQLACLDGVLARIDAVARAARVDRDVVQQVDAGELLVDPKVCAEPNPPRLMTATSPELRDAMATWLAQSATPVPFTQAAAATLVSRSATDPCASVLAHLLASDAQKTGADRANHLDEAQQNAERCGDDRMLADTAIASARHVMDSDHLSTAITTKLRFADAAVQRVAQRDLTARVELLRVEVATRAENLDEAIDRGMTAMADFAARGRLRAELKTGVSVVWLRRSRATPADVTGNPELLRGWRARAVAELGPDDYIVRSIDTSSALEAFNAGDLASANALLDRAAQPLPNDNAIHVVGAVVDESGQPVAGAKVTSGRYLSGNALRAGVAFSATGSMRTATTGPDGRFEIADAAEGGTVIAELGDRRSSPAINAASVKLALAPTSRIEGRIDLAGAAPSTVTVYVKETGAPSALRYATIAPVAADGSFVLGGVPRRPIDVFAAIELVSERIIGGPSLMVRNPVVKGVQLSLVKAKRVVHVLVRNTVATPLANAQVVVFPGKVASMTLADVNPGFRHGGLIRWGRPLDGERAPKAVLESARPGDLFATMTDVPEGTATACAVGLPNMSDAELEHKFQAHRDRVQLICTPIPDGAELVTVEVPPFPRLD